MAISNDKKAQINDLLNEGKTIPEICEKLNITREEFLANIDSLLNEPEPANNANDKQEPDVNNAIPETKDEDAEDKTATEDDVKTENTDESEDKDSDEHTVDEDIVNESKEAMRNAAKILGDTAVTAGAKAVDFGDKAYNNVKDVLSNREKQDALKAKAGDAIRKASVQFDKGANAAANAINEAFESARTKAEAARTPADPTATNRDVKQDTPTFDLDKFGRQVGEQTGRIVNGLGSVFGSLRDSFMEGYNNKGNENE